jgi:hypothetical protein
MLSGTGFVAAPETFENPPQIQTAASLNGIGQWGDPELTLKREFWNSSGKLIQIDRGILMLSYILRWAWLI